MASASIPRSPIRFSGCSNVFIQARNIRATGSGSRFANGSCACMAAGSGRSLRPARGRLSFLPCRQPGWLNPKFHPQVSEPMESTHVLIAEDNSGDIRLIRMALAEADDWPVTFSEAHDGEKAISFLEAVSRDV